MIAAQILSPALALSAALATAAQAASTTIIYSFGSGADGAYADTDLVRDASSNLYGTTVKGGTHASGTVWQLHPNRDGSWTHTVLFNFTGGADGSEPYKGVTLDAAGNLYGTAVTGGSGPCEGGCGVVYTLASNGGTWTQSVIHSFSGADGQGPGSAVTLDDHGNVFGTTPTGGTNGFGNIYELKRSKTGAWKFVELHPFSGPDGAGGSAGRLLFTGKAFYGANTAGGEGDAGNIFELKRSHGAWKYSVLYSFPGAPGAGFPYGGLMRDARGSLFGTTYYDGEYGLGGVYELAQKHGKWRGQVLYDFPGDPDGAAPISSLAMDSAGTLYGTTSAGGADDGTIFSLAPKGKGWKERVLHAFTDTPDGEYPYTGMIADGAGHFFGATAFGGEHAAGAIYEFTP